MMHGPINVISPNNMSKLQMGFNSVFKGLITMSGAALWPAALLPTLINLKRVCVCEIVGNPIMVAANPNCRKQRYSQLPVNLAV
jgi:hypothetical protein